MLPFSRRPAGGVVSSGHDGGAALREVMRLCPTGVTVVTARLGPGRVIGMTATSFTSVSLDPPLVLVCVERASSSHEGLVGTATFCVNVLGSGQADLALRFSAEAGRRRFAGVPSRDASAGSPILEGSVAWLECEVVAVHPGGDHSIVVGRVLESGVSGGEALAFYRGAYRSFES